MQVMSNAVPPDKRLRSMHTFLWCLLSAFGTCKCCTGASASLGSVSSAISSASACRSLTALSWQALRLQLLLLLTVLHAVLGVCFSGQSLTLKLLLHCCFWLLLHSGFLMLLHLQWPPEAVGFGRHSSH